MMKRFLLFLIMMLPSLADASVIVDDSSGTNRDINVSHSMQGLQVTGDINFNGDIKTAWPSSTAYAWGNQYTSTDTIPEGSPRIVI